MLLCYLLNLQKFEKKRYLNQINLDNALDKLIRKKSYCQETVV